MFSILHSPPPSQTGTMWSASQRLFRVTDFNPQYSSITFLLDPRTRFNLRKASTVLIWQTEQMPRSLANTCCRRYPGFVRRRHSWTHQSEQKVSRRGGTSREHQRQSARPLEPFGRSARRTRPPGITRCVLIEHKLLDIVLPSLYFAKCLGVMQGLHRRRIRFITTESNAQDLR